MARCKTKYYLNDVYASDVFDNIFPSNEISETSYSAKFDGKAGRRMFDHVIDVLVKVQFIDLSYMVEEHIPLNNPDHYPIYVINEFHGLLLIIYLLFTKVFGKQKIGVTLTLSVSRYEFSPFPCVVHMLSLFDHFFT